MPTQMPKRPSKVKVLTITYNIHWLSEDEWYAARLDTGSVGITERDSGTIALRADKTASEEALKATLLHEVLHTCTQAMRVECNLDHVQDGEEFFVSIVAPLLLAVLRENPPLTKYLLG